jgi:hypothetical protein
MRNANFCLRRPHFCDVRGLLPTTTPTRRRATLRPKLLNEGNATTMRSRTWENRKELPSKLPWPQLMSKRLIFIRLMRFSSNLFLLHVMMIVTMSCNVSLLMLSPWN